MCGQCGCGCGSNHHGKEHEEGHGRSRQFLTKAEKAEKLKSYAEEIRKELTAVEEHIKELEK